MLRAQQRRDKSYAMRADVATRWFTGALHLSPGRQYLPAMPPPPACAPASRFARAILFERQHAACARLPRRLREPLFLLRSMMSAICRERDATAPMSSGSAASVYAAPF